MIDEKLQQPLLSLPSRKKTRYARRASRTRGRSSPVPFKIASDEAPAEAVKAAPADTPPASESETPVTESRALTVDPSPADVPADAPKEAPKEASSDAPVDASSDVSADVTPATPTETITEAPKDLPADSSTDSPAKASTTIPADVSAAASTDATTEIAADTPTDGPATVPTDAPVDARAPAPANASAEIPSEALADAPTTASTDSPAGVPREVPTDAPTSTQTDSPVASSADAPEETPKAASTDVLDHVATEAVEAKPVEAAEPKQGEADATAAEVPAAKDAEASTAVEEIAAGPVKPVDDELKETSKAVTETPAEAEAVEKVPQDTNEPAAASEDTKSAEIKDAIPEDGSKDLTPEPKIVANETDVTDADPAPGATEAPAVEAPAEVAVSEAQPAAEDATSVKDDAPITDTPTAKAAEASTSDSHAPLEESLSKDVTATESASDKDDAPDAKAPIEALPAALEAHSGNVPDAPEKVSDEPSAKVPEEVAAKDVPVNGAPAEAAEVASPEDTVKDASEEPTGSEEPKAESISPEVSAKEAPEVSAKEETQAVTEETAAPEVVTSKAIAEDAPADVAATSAASQAEATSPEAAAQGATDAEVPAESSAVSSQEASEKLAEEAITKDAPVATVAAETSPATPQEDTKKAPEEAAATESPKAASLSYMSAVVPEEALDKAREEVSAIDGSEVVPEKAAEVALEKALGADIPVPSSTASPEEVSEKQAEQAATAEASDTEASDTEASDTEAPIKTSPSKVEKATKVTDEEASDDEEATAKDISVVETSAAPPVETAQASHEEAEEKVAEEPAAKDAPVSESLPEIPAGIPQASPEDTSSKASPEIDDKSATDSKTAPAEEKASDDKISSDVSSSAEPTAETIQADDSAREKPSDDLPVVSQPEEPEAVQDKTTDVPKVPEAAPLDPLESRAAAQEGNSAISKAAISPLALQEDSGIGQQASTEATNNDLPLDSHSGRASQKTADDELTTKDEPAVAKAHMGTDNAVIQTQNVDSDDAVSDATEGPNSPRASLHGSEDSYTGESVAEPLEFPEFLSAAAKEEPSQSSVPGAVKEPAEESGVRSLPTSEAKAQGPSAEKPEPQPRDVEAAGIPEVAVASKVTPTGTETTLTTKSIEDSDDDLAHAQEESPAHAHEAPQQHQSQTAQDQELQETPVGALEEPESIVSQPKVGGSSDADPMTGGSDERANTESERQLDTKGSSAAPTKQHSGPGLDYDSADESDYDSADESEEERDAPSAAKEGPVAATSPISDSPAPLSEGTLGVPSIRLNEEQDDTMTPGTPVKNITTQDTKTAEATEHAQPSSVGSVPEATGLGSVSGQNVDLVPSRQSSRSPLPVENTTVDGQEALFDDESVATDNEEDLGGNKIKESIVSYNPDEDEGPPTARLPVDGITRFRGNEVKSYEHLRDDDGDKIDLDLDQSRHASGGSQDGSPEQAEFTPRDVTNVTWRDRSESVNSYSTMSSTPSSPVQSIVHSDRHESAARDAWPASLGAASRSRGYSQLTNNTSIASTTDDFDPFRYDGNNMATKAGGIPSPPLPQPVDYRPRQIPQAREFSQPRDFYQPQESIQPQEMPQTREANSPRDFPLAPPESPAAGSRGSLAGSPMFAKIRGMFEGQPSAHQQQSDAHPSRSGSPTPSRPSSALFAPVGRERSSSLRKSVNVRDDNSEQSSLLGANEGTGSSGRY